MISSMAEVQHSIKFAALKSGLTPHVIRVWEKRYDAVSPNRTDTNRRLYSDAEIERLTLLRAATHAGHSIGNIARLPVEKLREIVGEARPAPAVGSTKLTPVTAVNEAVAAIEQLNSFELEEQLGRAAVAFGQHGLLQKVISPLAQKIGELWQEGAITAAHEHFASAVIRNFLIRNSKPYAVNGQAPTLIVGTPAGQLHELGAVMVAAAANDMGWRVVYLGTSLPAVEIAGTAIQHKARAVALSIVFPGDDPNLPHELESLRKHLPEEIKIIVGGRAAEAYAETLKKIDAVRAQELKTFYRTLEAMRVRVG
jgi:methylmalonyl-CoA mutase cobalamin-binding domain/chain